MNPTPGSAEHCLALAIQHVNAGQPGRAKVLCEHALAAHPPDAAVLQLLAVLCLKEGELERARLSIAHSLELRPDHAPLRRVAGDVAHAQGFALALGPPRAEVEVNLGVVLQDAGRIDEAMRAYGRAWRLNEDTFGRIAHALSAANVGRLWLDLDTLRETLRGLPA